MVKECDEKVLFGFKQTLMRQATKLDALNELLVEKGMITKEEFSTKLKQTEEVLDTKYLFLPEACIEIEAVSKGLRITQGSESYLAKEFKLTKDVVHFINLCVEKGFPCVIRDNHPKPGNRKKGVEYIGFSSHRNEPRKVQWVCVINKRSPFPKDNNSKLKQVCFEKRYLSVLKKAKVVPKIESKRLTSPGNYLVDFKYFERAISACAKNLDEID